MYDYENTNQSNKNIQVSNEFVDIYTNFNVVTQVEKMKQLTKRELYLLLTVCLDKFSDEDTLTSFCGVTFTILIIAFALSEASLLVSSLTVFRTI